MDQTIENPRGRRIIWQNVLTVVSAAILIGAEVFGAAFAAGWAFARLSPIPLGEYGEHILQGIFFSAASSSWCASSARRGASNRSPQATNSRAARYVFFGSTF